jgi:hypothetical protein
VFIRGVKELIIRNKDRLGDFAGGEEENNEQNENNESESADPNQSDMLSEYKGSIHLSNKKPKKNTKKK